MSISDLLIDKTPKYELTIPSTQTQVKYRPFLVKEEKILLIAQESNDNTGILEAIKTIINDCVEGISHAGELPLFDVEYIFLQLRAKSVGELIEPTILCPETKEKVELQVDIGELEVQFNPEHTKEIKISNDIVVSMKYPSLNLLQENNHPIESSDPIAFYGLLVSCIDSINTPQETVNSNNLPEKELEDFVDNLTKAQFEMLLTFFVTSPRLEHKTTYTTSEGETREVVLSGLADFFG